MKLLRGIVSLGLLLSIAVWSLALELKDETPNDPDFLLQGEYLGEVEPASDQPSGPKRKIGVQVIALGEGKFHGVAYFGGLPGDGWDGGDKKEADGALEGGAVTFKHDDITATLSSGVISVTAEGGVSLGDLQKVDRASVTLDAKPPEGAVVLFDGKTADAFDNGRLTDDGLLMQGVTSKQKFQSGTLHIEFRIPFEPKNRGQGRGNSGCYLQGRYEVQMLDSFGLSGENNECGGIYTIAKPKVNMAYPPLAWQTYDIDYTAAEFADGNKTKNALITVRHNGVVIHDKVELTHSTTAAPMGEGPEPGPIYLQDHGNPVRYRNIWWVDKK